MVYIRSFSYNINYMKSIDEISRVLNSDSQRYFNEFLNFLKLSNRSAHTIKNYSADLLKFMGWYQYLFKGRKISKVDRKIIDHYLTFLASGSSKISREISWLPSPIQRILLRDTRDLILSGKALSVGSQKRHLSTIKNFFEFLRESYGDSGRKFAINPVKNKLHSIRLKEVDTMQTKLLKKSDWNRINKMVLGSRELLILNLMYYGGLRLSEVCRLEVENFDLMQRSVEVERKGGKLHKFIPRRAQTIFKFLRMHLDRSDISEGPIFPGRDGGHISSKTVYNLVIKILKKIRIDDDITPHSFRKACATEMYAKSKDLLLVRDYLNHSDAAVTQTYIENLTIIQ